MLSRDCDPEQQAGVFCFMTLKYDDIADETTMEVTFYEDVVMLRLRDPDQGESIMIELEPENFHQLAKIYTLVYEKKEGWENFMYI